MISKEALMVFSFAGLMLVAGCSEQLAGAAQEAAAQMKMQALKMATEKLESLKTEALDQLTQTQQAQDKSKAIKEATPG